MKIERPSRPRTPSFTRDTHAQAHHSQWSLFSAGKMEPKSAPSNSEGQGDYQWKFDAQACRTKFQLSGDLFPGLGINWLRLSWTSFDDLSFTYTMLPTVLFLQQTVRSFGAMVVDFCASRLCTLSGVNTQ